MLNRVVSGLLARRIANHASVPFVTSEWTKSSGNFDLSIDDVGRLVLIANTLAPAWVGIRFNPTPGNLGKRMVQIVHRVNTAGIAAGPSLAVNPANARTLMGALVSIGRVPEDYIQTVEAINGTGSSLGLTFLATTKVINIDYRFSAFHDGTAVTGRDHLDGVTRGPDTGSRTVGHAGILYALGGAGRTMSVSEFFDCADRYLTVGGLEPDQIVRVRNAAGATLAEAAEVGGVATVDMLIVDLSAAHDVAVYDGAELVVAQEPDDGVVAGGDVWTFEAPPPPLPPPLRALTPRVVVGPHDVLYSIPLRAWSLGHGAILGAASSWADSDAESTSAGARRFAFVTLRVRETELPDTIAWLRYARGNIAIPIAFTFDALNAATARAVYLHAPRVPERVRWARSADFRRVFDMPIVLRLAAGEDPFPVLYPRAEA